MPIVSPRFTSAVVLAAALVRVTNATAVPYDQQPPLAHALYSGAAAVANVLPFASAYYAPKCLPGYVVCKIAFAGASIVVATAQLLFSGGGDLAQTRGILYRGFSGDWFLTGRHIAGEAEPRPLPDPPPPSTTGGEWVPPSR